MAPVSKEEYVQKRFHNRPSGLFYCIRNLRIQHYSLQRSHQRKPYLPACNLLSALDRSRRSVLAYISLHACRENRQERLSEDIRSLDAGLLHLPDNLPHRYPIHHPDGLLHPDSLVTDIYNGHSRHRHQGAHILAEGRRSCSKLCRHHLSYRQQDRQSRWGIRDHHVRNIHDRSEQSELFHVSGNIQAADRKISCGDIYEMDIPVCICCVGSVRRKRDHNARLDFHSPDPARRTGLPGSLRDIHNIFPDSNRSKTHQAHPCEHVQLCTAHHSHRHQHLHRHGLPDLAESSRCRDGLRRSNHSEL